MGLSTTLADETTESTIFTTKRNNSTTRASKEKDIYISVGCCIPLLLIVVIVGVFIYIKRKQRRRPNVTLPDPFTLHSTPSNAESANQNVTSRVSGRNSPLPPVPICGASNSESANQNVRSRAFGRNSPLPPVPGCDDSCGRSVAVKQMNTAAASSNTERTLMNGNDSALTNACYVNVRDLNISVAAPNPTPHKKPGYINVGPKSFHENPERAPPININNNPGQHTEGRYENVNDWLDGNQASGVRRPYKTWTPPSNWRETIDYPSLEVDTTQNTHVSK